MKYIKHKIAMVVLSLIFGACGGESKSGPACSDSALKGSWDLADGSTVTFKTDCTFSSNDCGESGTYENVTASSGTVRINVETSTCTGPADLSCDYVIRSGILAYVCEVV